MLYISGAKGRVRPVPSSSSIRQAVPLATLFILIPKFAFLRRVVSLQPPPRQRLGAAVSSRPTNSLNHSRAFLKRCPFCNRPSLNDTRKPAPSNEFVTKRLFSNKFHLPHCFTQTTLIIITITYKAKTKAKSVFIYGGEIVQQKNETG